MNKRREDSKMNAGYFRLMAFPVEIQDLIFQELEMGELPPVLRVNSHFNSIGTRILYRIIPELPMNRCIACLKVLCATPANAALVRKLSIDWSSHRIVANLFRLLRSTLSHLSALRHLSIELSPQDNHYSLAWLLHGCQSRLRTLGTSIRCDPQLAEVLETQPELVELCLRGFQTKQPFTLSDGAMPRLRMFRAVHAGPAVISSVVRGRPVEGISLSMFIEDAFLPLDALMLSSRPIKRLTIMSLDNTPPNVLLPEIANRLPELEALHVVVLMAMFDRVSVPCSVFGVCGSVLCARPLRAGPGTARLGYLTIRVHDVIVLMRLRRRRRCKIPGRRWRGFRTCVI